MSHRDEQRLALRGGMQAVSRLVGKGEPKIGIEEFMAVATRFGLSPAALKRIRVIVKQEGMGAGPFLANYYSGLKETANQAFERAGREMFGARYALAVSSGTGALHSAFVAAGVGPGTEVICPAIGFFATAAAVVMAKGIPVFCDVDESMQMDPRKIEQCITKRTVALAPTHWQGGICDMAGVMRVARRHRLRVIEDCAQSFGSTFRGKLAGTIGDLGCFSISAYKIVGGGEGGMVITDDERLWARANQVAECGGLWRPERFAPARYPRELFCGTNYRLSELEAAIDAVQIRRSPAMIRRFRMVRRRILNRLQRYRDIVPQKINDLDGEVGYALRFFPSSLKLSREIAQALVAEGIAASARGEQGAPDWHQYSFMFPVTDRVGPTEDNCPFECPLYLKAGGKARYSRGDCPVADDLFDRCVTVPLNQWFSAQDCRNYAAGINKVLSAFCTRDDKARAWLPGK